MTVNARFLAEDSSQVVLASASSSRKQLLENAGLPVECHAAAIDENEIKRSLAAEGASALQTAETLAELKAGRISRSWPGALVIGADQMLDCNGTWFDKPGDRDQATGHLKALSGRTHTLETSVCVVRDNERLWHHNETARLTMRSFDDDFIARYLDLSGEAILNSVGGYCLEGYGVHLFARVEGDFFTILGLPLLPLLGFLRDRGAVRG
ncbi:Maf family protein [Fodinicurvata halophila]|uniref:Nucleoside triphosphate pyrophosphatase n=1 Tax=Fodinicurvata halophila TaxID=1419723 RepID=A0ABV8UM27_9PROT